MPDCERFGVGLVDLRLQTPRMKHPLSSRLGFPVEGAIRLLEEGNTIPFINGPGPRPWGVKQDGLLHRSQVPRGTVLSVGQVLEVEILEVQRERNRISLGMA